MTNYVLPFAQGAGANALSDLAWATVDILAQGFQAGIVPSNKLNKVLRQSTSVASGFGQFTSDWSGIDFSDALSPSAMSTNFRIAMAAAMAGARFTVDSSQIVNSVAAVFTPALPSVTGSHQLWVKIANTNTGPATLSENGQVSAPIQRQDGAALQAGDLIGGVTYVLIRDGGAYKLVGWARSELANMIATAIANSGGGGGGGGSGGQTGAQIIAANGIPSNVKRINNTSRAALSGQGTLSWVNAMTVSGYSKVSGAGVSNLLIIAEIVGYTAQQGGAGATYQQLTDGNGHADQKQLASSFNLQSAGPVSIADTVSFLLVGVPAGAVNLTLQWSRQDGLAWNTIANPDGVDYGGSGSHTGQGSTSSFLIMELPV